MMTAGRCVERGPRPAITIMALCIAIAAAGCGRQGGEGTPNHISTPVTATLTLPSTILRSGSSLKAQVTVENHGAQPLHIVGCGSIFALLLIGTHYHPTAVWPMCAQQITVPVGASTYTVTIAAKYDRCSPSGDGLRRCSPDGSMPPLPPGRYAATTFAVTANVPVPAPVMMTVTR